MPPITTSLRITLAAAFNRYPDLRVVIEDIVAEGDKVVVRNRWQATDGQSGKAIEFTGIVFWRISGGKLAESGLICRPPTPFISVAIKKRAVMTKVIFGNHSRVALLALRFRFKKYASILFRPKPNVEKTPAAPKASPLCCGS
jgi:hypothetical protein